MIDQPKMSLESSKDASDAPERKILTWGFLREASRELTEQIITSGWIPDLTAAIARGGFIPAGVVSYAMGVKACGTMNVEFYTGVGQTLEEPQLLPPLMDASVMSGKRVFIVGDVADPGKTLKMVMDLAKEHGLFLDEETQTKADTCCAVIYKRSVSIIEPDYMWRHADKWISFPRSALSTIAT